jgi:hypothetical protein
MKPSISKNSQKKMDWRCGSSDTMCTLQVQITEFNPQSHQKNTPKNKKQNKKPDSSQAW